MRIGLAGLACFFTGWCAAQVSPFTGHAVVPPDSLGRYRLLIGGHFHGESSNVSGYPASTVLANIELINATGANVFLSTGDLFMRPDHDSARYVSSFFSKLKLPLFNAPGNHDLEGRAFRVPMPQRMDLGADRILLLDTERDDSDIRGDQFAALEALAREAASGKIRRVFIVSHRPVWAEGNARYQALFSGNTRSLLGANYEKEVLPVVRRIASRAQVLWISGSMAGRAPASLFFQPHEANITYIQCAVRDQLRDAVLVADVSPSEVKWTLLSLTGEPVLPVETYDAGWWVASQGKDQGFNWRRMPYLVRKELTSATFWYGFGSALVVVLAGIRLRRARFWVRWHRGHRQPMPPSATRNGDEA